MGTPFVPETWTYAYKSLISDPWWCAYISADALLVAGSADATLLGTVSEIILILLLVVAAVAALFALRRHGQRTRGSGGPRGPP